MRRADVPALLLKRLNKGEEEALTLAEMLAVDLSLLMKNAFPDVAKDSLSPLHPNSDIGWLQKTRLAGNILYQTHGKRGLQKTLRHSSDQVRGWGAALVAAIPDLCLEERLSLIRPIADDPNPGVRETAWIMLRPHLADNICASLNILMPWTKEDAENIRRYASEITRPRGVWCTHIPLLRQKPELGLPLLEKLKSDPSRYVQNSVANWLNDASKDAPDFVRHVCKKWQKENTSKETAYICKRALRTLNKKDKN